MGAPMAPRSLEDIQLNTNPFFRPIRPSKSLRDLRHLLYPLYQRNDASRIPKLRRAITAQIEKLTAFTVLIIQSQQSKHQDSQERIEECVGESHNLLIKSSTDHAIQLDSISDRLDASQARIESQLQTILANQQRSKTPILSQSLNASSPEGRQTWMELGRLLRDEGITPAMIQENRGLLVNAMKSTLRDESLSADSTPQSYATAPEYHADDTTTLSVSQPRNLSHQGLPLVSSAMSLLGSAPPRSSGFTDAFLKGQNGAASSLDQEQNVNNGVQSLLKGMTCDEISRESEGADMDDLELEEVEPKGASTYNEERQRQGVSPAFEPLVPALTRGDSLGECEEEDTGADFEIAETKSNKKKTTTS